MLHAVKSLTKAGIRATDGDIGHVEDLFFDDERWAIRYLVVDTGAWLPGRQVLLSPYAVGRLVPDEQVLTVAVTRSQIERSPDVNAHQPISRQYEASYARYYGYPYYWGTAAMWGNADLPSAAADPLTPDARRLDALTEADTVPPEALPDVNPEDVHLRSCRDVTGYHIDATDGDIGHIADFLVDDETWAIRYLVVDTSNWWFGNKVLISPHWVDAVSWADSKAVVNLTRTAIQQAPPYDPDAILGRDQEELLERHYGRR
jgi:hypothetical protein